MEAGEAEFMKRFVTFEGIDGSGKSTVSEHVYDQLKTAGYDVVLTCEPTDTKIGRFVQECIKKKSDPFVTSFAFIADRIEHCSRIQQWLQQGKIVLCDRYCDSTYAYQGSQLESEVNDPIKWLQELSRGRILVPDRTFLFVIAPAQAVTRIQNRQELIPFEQVSFLEKVHANYLKLSKEKRFLLVDAAKTVEELTDLCYQDIIH